MASRAGCSELCCRFAGECHSLSKKPVCSVKASPVSSKKKSRLPLAMYNVAFSHPINCSKKKQLNRTVAPPFIVFTDVDYINVLHCTFH